MNRGVRNETKRYAVARGITLESKPINVIIGLVNMSPIAVLIIPIMNIPINVWVEMKSMFF